VIWESASSREKRCKAVIENWEPRLSRAIPVDVTDEKELRGREYHIFVTRNCRKTTD
jgi:predicted component of type VI protein secretion system